VVSAAQLLGSDASFVTELRGHYAYSTQPTAAQHNQENLDLGPLWPKNLISISDTSAEFALAKRSYTRSAR
jgi:hypothetical protein